MVQEVLQRRWEPWRWAQWPAIGSWQTTIKSHRWSWSSSNYMRRCQRTQCWPFDPLLIWHLKQIGKVKKPNKWMPHELTKNQNNHHFEVSSSLILHNNNEPFLDWIVMCNEKWILYGNRQWVAQWLDWEEASKHFPEPNPFCTIKGIILTIQLSANPRELTHCGTGSAGQYQ